MNIDTLRIIDTATDITQANNLTSKLTQQARRDASHISKTLHNYGAFIRRHALVEHRLTRHYLDTARSRLKTALTSTDSERLASNYGRHRIALMHRKGIHHPRHHLGIGIHIWSRNVTIGTYED